MTIAPERQDIEHLDFEPAIWPPDDPGTDIPSVPASPMTILVNGDVMAYDLAEARRITNETLVFLRRNRRLWEAICKCSPSRGELLG